MAVFGYICWEAERAMWIAEDSEWQDCESDKVSPFAGTQLTLVGPRDCRGDKAGILAPLHSHCLLWS